MNNEENRIIIPLDSQADQSEQHRGCFQLEIEEKRPRLRIPQLLVGKDSGVGTPHVLDLSQDSMVKT